MKKGLREMVSDGNNHISMTRILSVWGYALLTVLLIMDAGFNKSIDNASTLYTWLIGASAGGKAAGKYIENFKNGGKGGA